MKKNLVRSRLLSLYKNIAMGSSINDTMLRRGGGLHYCDDVWRMGGGLKEVWRHTRHICGKAQQTAKFMLPTRRMCQDEEHLGTLCFNSHNFMH